MELNMNVGWVRGVSSWQPVTKLSKGALPALENVAVWVSDGTVTAMATDRYRMVYSLTRDVPGAVDAGSKPFLIPMDTFTRFVAATKHLQNGNKLLLSFADDEVSFDDNAGIRVVSPAIPGQYPKIQEWVASWVPASTVKNEATWNMKLLADIVKFCDPAHGLITAAKRDSSWDVTAGDPDVHSGAFRFDQGSPDTFAVWVMPVKRAVK